jgi:hypothetical protein
VCAGLSPVAYGANVLGTSIETDRASAETFEGAMRSPGVITMDMILKKGQRDEIREHVKKVSADGGVMVLEKGHRFPEARLRPRGCGAACEPVMERRGDVPLVSRGPAMIGHGSKDSNWGTGLEQKMLWFLTFTLRLGVRIEQAVRKSLLTPVERLRYLGGVEHGRVAARGQHSALDLLRAHGGSRSHDS